MLKRAAASGAIIARGESLDPEAQPRPLILACGRRSRPSQGDRLFGFKAHFEGPCDDAVELFFDRHGYAGVSGIENGLTNVCAIAPESLLRTFEFDFDAVITRSRPLAERIGPLRRRMPWIVTGPVAFARPSAREPGEGLYPAGDSLGFVDPFTGTGILNALFTGRLAGTAAARQVPVADYLKQCAAALARPFWVSALLRRVILRAELYWLAPWIPGQALFRWTRANLPLRAC
jgi:flavin-dependent dehydrogenase